MAQGDFRVRGSVLTRYMGKDPAVTVPAGITAIGKGAFHQSFALEELRLPEGLKEIRAEAFHSCCNLRTLRLPLSLKAIRESAFAWCDSLETVRVPPRVRRLEAHCFLYCKRLKVLELPEDLTYIHSTALTGCEELETLRFPEDATRLVPGVFQDLDAFTRRHLRVLEAPNVPLRTLPLDLRRTGVVAKVAWIARGNALSPELDADLEAHLKEQWPGLLKEAADNLPLLALLLEKNVLTREAADTLLSRVSEAGNPEAVAMLLDWQGKLPPLDLEEQSRQALRELETGSLSPEAFDASWTARPWKRSGLLLLEYHGPEKENIVVPSARGGTPVLALADGLFEDNPDVVSVFVPEGVRKIGQRTFSHCPALRRVELPSTLKEIPAYAFLGCPSVKVVQAKPNP